MWIDKWHTTQFSVKHSSSFVITCVPCWETLGECCSCGKVQGAETADVSIFGLESWLPITVHVSLERNFFSREKKYAINICSWDKHWEGFPPWPRVEGKLVCTQEVVESPEKQGPDNIVPISLISDRTRERNFCGKPDCYYSPYLLILPYKI